MSRRGALAWLAVAATLAASVATVAGTAAAPASAATTDGVDLAVEASTSSTGDGNVTVEITVTNEGDQPSVAPVATVGRLPEGYRVVGNASADGTYRSSTRQFLWFELPPGESVSANVTLTRSDNASGGTVPIRVDDDDGHTASTNVSVGSGGGLLSRLPTLAAVAALVAVVAGGAYAYRRRGRRRRRPRG